MMMMVVVVVIDYPQTPFSNIQHTQANKAVSVIIKKATKREPQSDMVMTTRHPNRIPSSLLALLVAIGICVGTTSSLQVSLSSTLTSVVRPRNIYQNSFYNQDSTSFNEISESGRQRMIRLKSQEKVESQAMVTNDNSNIIIAKIGSSASTVVAGLFFIALSYQRDAFMLTFFIGSILNGIASKILKKVLNQDRPTGFQDNSSIGIKPSDKGMPSSHAMSLGFIGIYTAIALCNGLLQNAGIISQIGTCSALFIYVTICLIYRVQSQLHTRDQVFVGLFFGTLNGLMWYSLATGNNMILPSVNIMDKVSTTLLPDTGIFPTKFLIFPLMVGAAVVGSFERRISGWIKKTKTN